PILPLRCNNCQSRHSRQQLHEGRKRWGQVARDILDSPALGMASCGRVPVGALSPRDGLPRDLLGSVSTVDVIAALGVVGVAAAVQGPVGANHYPVTLAPLHGAN